VEEETAGGEEAAVPEGISWTGTIGAVMGSGAMALIAIGVMIDPGSGSRWWSLLFVLPAIGFLPALRASVRPSPNRERVQRATVIGCLMLVVVSSIMLGGVGLLIAVVLMPAAALLAIAAGLIFQGPAQTPAKKKKK
jgi:hypothetical protein